MHEQANGNDSGARRTALRAVRPWVAGVVQRWRLLFLTLGLWCVPVDGAVDPYTSEFEKSPQRDFFQRARRAAAEQQELYRTRVFIPEAVMPALPEAASPAKIRARAAAQAARSHARRQYFFAAALLLLIVALAARKFLADLVLHLNQAFNPWVPAPSTVAGYSENIRAEDAAFDRFVVAFRDGPSATPAGAPLSAGGPEPLEGFPAEARKHFVTVRGLLQDINPGAKPATWQKILSDLGREMRALTGATALPELLPAWQTASALEGLLKQLTERTGNVTPSTLRTVSAAVDLLEDLCEPGVRPDLLSNPPLRLLVVDDDIISRKALSLALKKALTQPDLAEDGEKALALATLEAYDAIFLDVQMPGMDGFEVCANIHKTVPNAATPVVFVTCLGDFDARAQSVLSGGSDLIAKPFLTFEITVKALTLVLRGRLLAAGQPVAEPGVMRDRLEASLLLKSEPPAALTAPAVLAGQTVASEPPGPTVPDEEIIAAPGEFSPDELTRAFLARASARVGPLRDQVQAVFQAADPEARQGMLADLYLSLHALMPAADSGAAHPALAMSTAMEGLLKKLLENPKHCTSSTLYTLATAVDALGELCVSGVKADLATNPPIHVLVADDDPITRRVITSAVQTAFEKPDNADCGEAALALAAQKPFDVIFLDVLMPGMDGFTACSKIRETAHNRTTPVVFVTGQSDFKARSQATVSGGNDLMGKPFLTAEITVKALTFALRGRLRKLRSGVQWKSLAADPPGDEAGAGASPSDRAVERRDARRRARRFKRARQSWYQSA